ncbi:MAG TPA: CoA transferase [Gemmatimonadota bacterium]|nr:CoA transferase [Gemmatimonadota bacterium]
MPLSHLTVLEFAGVLAGPSVGMFLAELGARVVKVENPAVGGDVTRHWSLGAVTSGEAESSARRTSRSELSPYFAAVNWGKESVALDFARPQDLDAAHQLARRADVILVSYKPGDAEKFGLDYASVRAENPDVVYGEITAYGPDDDRPGYDAVIQAATGFTYINGEPDGPPLKLPVALMDVLAGHQLKEAILLALLRRERTGEGGKVSVSLIRSGLAALVNQATNWLVAGRNPRRLGSGHPNIVPYGSSFETADGSSIVLAVGNDRQFAALCEVLGASELARDDRYATNPARVTHRRELEATLAEILAELDPETLLEELADAGVPAGPILDVREALSQQAAEPLLLEAHVPGLGTLRGLRTVAFDPSGPYRPRSLSAPPKLGEHTARVREELAG